MSSSAFTVRVDPDLVPWADLARLGPEYLDPPYYDRILKPYVFRGASDLDLFDAFVTSARLPKHSAILEIGPGTGRATDRILRHRPTATIDLLDQSERMLRYLTGRLPAELRAKPLREDAVAHLARTSATYDFVYSLWSLSHSIHQNIARSGEHQGGARSSFALRKLFGSLLKHNAKFFFVHFDSTSDEQTIALRQRARLQKHFRLGEPSPSQRIIERVLLESAAEGQIRFTTHKLKGEPIVYAGIDEALEVFMNFHMEGAFNRTALFVEVLSELESDLRRFQAPDGSVAIRPGCVIYSGERL